MQAGSHGWKTEVTKKVEKVWSDACAPRNWFWCSFPFSPPPLSCCRAAATVGALCQSREWEVFPLLPKTQWEHRQKPLLFCLFSQHSCLPREACPVSTSKESSSSRKRGVGKKNGKLVTCFTSCLSMVCCMLKIEEQLTCELSKHECNI